MKQPTLTLDTLAPEREFVLIKTKSNRRGVRCGVKRPEDLSLREQAQLARMEAELAVLQPEVDKYLDAGDMNDGSDAVDRYEDVITALIATTLDGATAKVLGELKLPHKIALMGVFMMASSETPKRAGQARKSGKGQKGRQGGPSGRASKSPASNGSSAGTKRSGSTSRRGS